MRSNSISTGSHSHGEPPWTVAPRWLASTLRCIVVLSTIGALSAIALAQPREYLVGPKDVLVVTVFNQPELSGKFEVGADGALTFPLVGRVAVAGLSTRGVEQALFAKLSPAFLRNPQVTVSVDAYLSQQFFVLGEVNAPGSYYIRGDETLIQAIARAGSTKADASDEILVVRPRAVSAAAGPVRPDQADERDVRRLSMNKLANGGLDENITIQNGDTIFVPRAESVFILGQVKNPGPYRFSKTVTVLQLLSMAGGPTDRGATNRITIVRVVNGKKQEIKAGLSETVVPNDTIMVPEKFF
jgi:polysaccharide export outer membrane protein